MRYQPLMHPAFLVALLVLATSARAEPPPLKALDGFSPGMWRQAPIGGGAARSQCLADVGVLLTDGRAAPGCAFTVLGNDGANAVVTYRCAGKLSGRTVLRRDAAGIYTTDAQGLEGGLPFAGRSEWRLTGSC